MAIHFIGFRGEEYISAVKVWGVPDFYHVIHDGRCHEEIDYENDIVIFANGYENKFSNIAYNDSIYFWLVLTLY